MNKTLYFISVFLLLFISACSKQESTTASYIKVIEKGHEGEYWILVENPSIDAEEKFKLYVEDMNTWNLIENNREYFASYSTKSNHLSLTSIHFPGQQQQ